MPQLYGYQGSRTLPALTSAPCQFGKCPPEHNHTHNPFDASNPGYFAYPEDLVPGWTAQQIGRVTGADVPKYCILCWELEQDLTEHACEVLALLA
jgi:hypothetical protein